jgi:hypothetical protein
VPIWHAIKSFYTAITKGRFCAEQTASIISQTDMRYSICMSVAWSPMSSEHTLLRHRHVVDRYECMVVFIISEWVYC